MRLHPLLDRFVLVIAIALGVLNWSYSNHEKIPVNSNVSHSSHSVIVQNRQNRLRQNSTIQPVDDQASVGEVSQNDPTFTTPSEEELQCFPGASVVEAAEVEGPEANQSTHVKILKTDFKCPLVRSEEVIDKATGKIVARQEMAADHLLMTLPRGQDPAAFLANAGVQAAGISQLVPGEPIYYVTLTLSTIASLPEALKLLSDVGTPDMIHYPIDVPVNPSADPSWGLTKIGGELNIFTAASKKNAAASIVAVIDTGISYNNPELNMWHNPVPTCGDVYGWNAYATDNHSNPMDDNGHGTSCAGILGAAGNNTMGFSGVVPNVELMACKALNEKGVGMVSDEVICIYYACAHGAKVLNCSFGGDSSPILYDALNYAQALGVICVAAAGNNGYENQCLYPAAYGTDNIEGKKLDNVVAVAASTETDTLASFSNAGQAVVPIAAPGVNICSLSNDGKYYVWSGTSMAAPYVTGALVLMKAQFPNKTSAALIAQLFNATDKVAGLTGKVTFGRLNITKALTAGSN